MTQNQKLALLIGGVAAVGAVAVLMLMKKKKQDAVTQQIAVAEKVEEVPVATPAKKNDTLKKVAIGAGIIALGIGLGEILQPKKKQTKSVYSPADKLAPTKMSGSTLLDSYIKK